MSSTSLVEEIFRNKQDIAVLKAEKQTLAEDVAEIKATLRETNKLLLVTLLSSVGALILMVINLL